MYGLFAFERDAMQSKCCGIGAQDMNWILWCGAPILSLFTCSLTLSCPFVYFCMSLCRKDSKGFWNWTMHTPTPHLGYNSSQMAMWITRKLNGFALYSLKKIWKVSFACILLCAIVFFFLLVWASVCAVLSIHCIKWIHISWAKLFKSSLLSGCNRVLVWCVC